MSGATMGETAGVSLSRRAPTENWDEKSQRRSRRKRTVWLVLGRIAILALLIGAWQFASGRIVDEFWISSPVKTAERLWGWTTDGTLVTNTVATLWAMLLGFVVGAATGIIAGFILGRIPPLADLLAPFITAIYSLPKIALAPLFILWFGIDLESKVALTAVVVFFLVFYNTFAGVRSVDEDLVDVLKVMGASPRTILVKVILPGAASWIYTGLRLAVPYALVGAVVAEIVASDRGIGHLLARSSGTFDTSGTFASLLLLMIIATIINWLVDKAEARTGRWNKR